MKSLMSRSQPELSCLPYLLMNTALTDTRQTKPSAASPCEAAAVNDDWLEQYDKAVWHPEYQCTLHTWLSRGKVRQGKKNSHYRYFLFLEFRDRSGASQYAEFCFDSLQSCLTFQRNEAAIVSLPAISPSMTRKKPIAARLP